MSPKPNPRAPGHPAGAAKKTGGETLPAIAFSVGILGSLGFAVVYFAGANIQLMAIMLFLMTGGVGVGLVVWAQRFMTPPHPDVEPRGRMESTEEEIAEFHADFSVGEHEMERRSLLTKLLFASAGAAGVAAIVPLESLGPPASDSFTETPYKNGTKLVDEEGHYINAESINPNGVITVFPEGSVGDEFAQTLLIGLVPGKPFNVVPGREGWTPNNMAAFSKVCTHVGCPVGLFEAETGQLLCPCHQSTFDVYNSCQPVFGPAATPLPQLPLGIEPGTNHVIATGDFSYPPGPGFWNQGKDAEKEDE